MRDSTFKPEDTCRADQPKPAEPTKRAGVSGRRVVQEHLRPCVGNAEEAKQEDRGKSSAQAFTYCPPNALHYQARRETLKEP